MVKTLGKEASGSTNEKEEPTKTTRSTRCNHTATQTSGLLGTESLREQVSVDRNGPPPPIEVQGKASH